VIESERMESQGKRRSSLIKWYLHLLKLQKRESFLVLTGASLQSVTTDMASPGSFAGSVSCTELWGVQSGQKNATQQNSIFHLFYIS